VTGSGDLPTGKEGFLMSSQAVSSAPPPTVPAEALIFAREHGVEQYLQGLIELARQVYPGATRFEVFVEDDPDVVDRYLVFELDAPLSVEEALEADRRWQEGWLRIYPYPRTCLFRKSVNLP
jgi:hypothetical protein